MKTESRLIELKENEDINIGLLVDLLSNNKILDKTGIIYLSSNQHVILRQILGISDNSYNLKKFDIISTFTGKKITATFEGFMFSIDNSLDDNTIIVSYFI